MVGFKSSFRRLPRISTRPDNAYTALFPFSEFGPLARTVEDVALMFDVMSGPHPRDPFSLPAVGSDPRSVLQDSIDGLSIGFVPDMGLLQPTREVREIVSAAVDMMLERGLSVDETTIDFGHPQEGLADLWMQSVAVSRAMEADVLLEAGIDILGDHRADVHPRYLEDIETGRTISAADHERSRYVLTDVLNAVEDVFEEYDLIVGPTLAVPPVKNDPDGYTTGPSSIDGVTVDPHIGWCLTYPFNFTGHPAASIPAGLTDDGLPVGMQLVGRRLDDETVLAACSTLERMNPWIDTYPTLSG